MTIAMPSLEGIILSAFPKVTTHLKHANAGDLSLSLILPYDAITACLAVTYNRYTVKYPGENKASKFFWTAVLGFLAFSRYDYWIQVSVHLLSFSPYFYKKVNELVSKGNDRDGKSKELDEMHRQTKALTILMSGYLVIFHLAYSMAYPNDSNSFLQSKLFRILTETNMLRTPMIAMWAKSLKYLDLLFPIKELKSAHDILIEFLDPQTFYAKIRHLLFVTFHIQVGMGFLGISFLRAEQNRKNALVKIEDEVKRQNEANGKEAKTNGNSTVGKKTNTDKNRKSGEMDMSTGQTDASAKFRRGAGSFIFFAAFPYMVQIVGYGATNMYAFHCFRDDIHRTIRLNDLFDNDGSRFVATASSTVSNLSPGAYATNAETVVKTVYDLFNQNLFSLPKLMLLPSIVAKQPLLLMKITPLILFSDYVKSTIVSVITTEVERINKEVKDTESMRTKVEQYDLKNSELIQRSGYESVLFTEKKWMSLTEKIQDLNARTSIMTRSKMYFVGLQRHFVMMALVDCALAKLIAVGKIVAADIFVYARAIEDMINFVLMRSRAESELASMMSSIKVLRELKDIWDASEDRNLLDCTISEENSLNIAGLTYTRGSASVRIDDVSISSGIYAVTGANGSGKSTLFRLVMGCKSNEQSVDVHSSIVLNNEGAIRMPSSNVVEITQNFYFPLFTSPFEWIYNIDIFEDKLGEERKVEMVERLANSLKDLNFYPETQLDQSKSTLTTDITTMKDDWFSDLSGGQKSKVELVRKVFLEDKCPRVLLIDETFAPLDPESKNLVMQRLKSFCSDSIVLVIYHADVKVSESEDSDLSSENACVESSNFFTDNLHVEDGALKVRPVCADDLL
eukprot:780957_1